MLVRFSYTESESVGISFDDAQNRVTPHIQHDNWGEFLVAWRKDRLELYKDHVRSFLLSNLITFERKLYSASPGKSGSPVLSV